MLREIEDCMTALSSNAIEYTDDGVVCPLYRSGYYNSGPKSTSTILKFACAIFTMSNLVY